MLETKPWCNSRHGGEIVGLFGSFLGFGVQGLMGLRVRGLVRVLGLGLRVKLRSGVLLGFRV